MKRVPLPFLIPIVALLFVVLWGGGLGAIFIFVGKAGAEQWGGRYHRHEPSVGSADRGCAYNDAQEGRPRVTPLTTGTGRPL